MKRKFLLIFLLLAFINMLPAFDNKTAQISFTAGLLANIGFTSSPVGEDDYLKPTELSGANALFEFTTSAENYNVLSAGSFYIYYQIFTPYQLKVYAEITPLKAQDGSNASDVYWTDSSDSITDVAGSNGFLIFEDNGTDKTKPRAGSKMISPVIEGENLNSIEWRVEYEGTITLKVVVG